MALLNTELGTYDHLSRLRPTRIRAEFLCSSGGTEQCLVWNMPDEHKPQLPAYPWTYAEFPASVSTDSLLTVSISMTLGPDDLSALSRTTLCFTVI